MKYLPKKKRLVLLAAMAVAGMFGWLYGWWISATLIGLMALLLGGLRGLQYAMAHAGISGLAAKTIRYRTDAMIGRIKAGERPGEPFAFVVLGDTRSTRKVPPEIHQKAKEENADFIFNTGDLVRFGTAREFTNLYVPLLAQMDPIPVLSVPGNHDRGARNDFAAYRAVHGAERFSFDYGSCRFVGVNNSKRARMEAGDINYLRAELSKSPIANKFVFIHIPPRFFEDDIVLVEKRRGFKKFQKEFRELMTEQGVAEVFMGHIHGYAQKMVDGVRYTLTAGAGAPLSKRLPPESRVHNYVVLCVDGSNFSREVVRSINGQWVKGSC